MATDPAIHQQQFDRIATGKGFIAALDQASVLALFALGRTAEAQAEATDGELAAVWWREFSAGQPRAMPGQTERRGADE